MKDFHAFIEPFGRLVLDPRVGLLSLLLISAAVSDYRSYRIPNWLTFGGATFALAYSAVVPFTPHLGLLWAVGGLALGFMVMLPLYALGVMGAGDVKLMAMTGAFLGVSDALYVIVLSFMAGGVAALTFAVYHRAWRRMAENLRQAAVGMAFSIMGGVRPDVRIEEMQSVGKLPYGVCISVAALGYLAAKQLGYA